MPVQADAGAGTVPGGGVVRQGLDAKARRRGVAVSSTLDPDLYKPSSVRRRRRSAVCRRQKSATDAS
jgi:hypothetical protein